MEGFDREKVVFDHQAKLIQISYEAAARVQGDVIRMLFLINGGALLALLALMGAVAKRGAVFPDSLGGIVMTFVNGLVAAVVAAAFSWIYHDWHAGARHRLLVDGELETERKAWATGLLALGLVIAIIVSLSCCLSAMSKSSVALAALAKSIPPAAAAPGP